MDSLKIFSPYDHHLIKEIPFHDEQQAEKMLALAYQTFQQRNEWLSAYQRIDILEKTITILQSKRTTFIHAASEEGGKPLIDSEVEIDRGIQGIKIAISHLMQMHGEQIPTGITRSSINRMAYTYREPIGVVFAISAFNHPFNLIIHQVIPAIAVGCPVIVKPASTTPLSAFNIVEALYEAGLPKAWCQVLVCKNTMAEKLVSDARIHFFSFIGSGKVGWYLRSKLAPGVHCTLEHGGAAPVIIDEDADKRDAIPLLTKGGFYHAGQVCVSVQRVFAQASISEEVAESIAALAKNLHVGDPTQTTTEVGPLIDPKEVDRVDEWVTEALDQGATLLCGGKKLANNCYAPTVLLNPPLSAHVSQQEIFGPVISVYAYHEIEKAVAHANELPFVFQAAVFSKNIDTAFTMVKQLKANTVLINDHTAFRMDWMPFAGSEQSGLGTGGIPYAMRDMTHEKLWVLRSTSV